MQGLLHCQLVVHYFCGQIGQHLADLFQLAPSQVVNFTQTAINVSGSNIADRFKPGTFQGVVGPGAEQRPEQIDRIVFFAISISESVSDGNKFFLLVKRFPIVQ